MAARDDQIGDTVDALAPIVEIDRISHAFGHGDARNPVLVDNNLSIGPGQFVIMTGPSGSGKTTLLTLIGALRRIQQGEITVLGARLAGLPQRDLVQARRNIGFIFQAHNLFESLSAFENVKMAMQLGSCPPAAMRERGVEILSRLDLANRVDYRPAALSGGQCQRVAIARALVNRPRLILADEPTASLDKESTMRVIGLFQELVSQERCSIVMVTHDNRVLDAADRIVNMVDGRIVSDVFVREAALLCEFLSKVSGFQSLDPSALAGIAEKMPRRAVPAGHVLITQGEIGYELFVIRSGRVAVSVGEGDAGRRLAELGRGDFFGERALITGEARNASVTALEETVVYTLDKDSFEAALKASPTFKEQVFAVFFRRQ